MTGDVARIETAKNARHHASTQAPLIELENIQRTFVTEGGVKVQALRGVSLRIHAGEFVAIMGPSGSGKSTLMNILGCIDTPTCGTYRLREQEVQSFNGNDLARLRREEFGFVFQSYNLLHATTALENVEVPAIYAGIPPTRRKARASRLLTDLGLETHLHHRPNQLSGGQQQRVSIARALMNSAHVILADEPTGALDSESGDDVLKLLEQLAGSGHTVILITHDRQIAGHADRRIEMHDGRIVADIEQKSRRGQAHSHTETPHNDIAVSAASLWTQAGEAIRMAFASLHTNKFRTLLTLLGIVIGVAAVVSMLAIGHGAERDIIERITALGANQLQVRPDWRRGGASTPLTFEDARLLPEYVPNVKAVLPEITGEETLRYGSHDYSSPITATSANLPETRNWPVASGVFFGNRDSDTYTPVAVIGSTVRDKLFPEGTDPLGEYILIRKVPFQVIGVMSSKGASGFGGRDQDNVVFVPLKTGGLRLFGRTNLRAITVAVVDPDAIDATETAVASFLRQRHGSNNFRIFNSAELLENVSASRETFTTLLGSVAAISLLVGGIGVMNIMLVSVTERTREIGVRVATGARQSDILLQFLTEAMAVSAFGGAVGVLAGIGIGALLDKLGTPVVFNLWPIVLALGCAVATGLIFGYAPARKAARMDPVLALATE